MILLTVCNTFYYVWNRVFYYVIIYNPNQSLYLGL